MIFEVHCCDQYAFLTFALHAMTFRLTRPHRVRQRFIIISEVTEREEMRVFAALEQRFVKEIFKRIEQVLMTIGFSLKQKGSIDLPQSVLVSTHSILKDILFLMKVKGYVFDRYFMAMLISFKQNSRTSESLDRVSEISHFLSNIREVIPFNLIEWKLSILWLFLLSILEL